MTHLHSSVYCVGLRKRFTYPIEKRNILRLFKSLLKMSITAYPCYNQPLAIPTTNIYSINYNSVHHFWNNLVEANQIPISESIWTKLKALTCLNIISKPRSQIPQRWRISEHILDINVFDIFTKTILNSIYFLINFWLIWSLINHFVKSRVYSK